MKLSAMSNLIKLFAHGMQQNERTKKRNFSVHGGKGATENEVMVFKVIPKDSATLTDLDERDVRVVISDIVFTWNETLLKFGLCVLFDPKRTNQVTVIEKNKTISSLEIDYDREDIFHSGNETI